MLQFFHVAVNVKSPDIVDALLRRFSNDEKLAAKKLWKCKLSVDLHSLMWSSRNLGQVETVRQKRQREVQYSKAGVKLSHSYQPFKKRAMDHSSYEKNRVEGKSYEVTQDERGILKISSFSSLSSEDLNITDVVLSLSGQADLPGKLVAGDNMMLSRLEYQEKCLSHCNRDDESIGQCKNEVPETFLDSSRLHSDSLQESVLASPTVVPVKRPMEVESQRRNLPIVMMAQEIMEAINEKETVIICGETGCGKTTQVPQGSVLATAKRVAFELDLRLGKEVGFQVRHDKRVGDNCHIKFMTDGVLLWELQADFLLKRHSVIILDEAHERSLNTDILIGMLSRVISMRQRLYEEQTEKIDLGECINLENRIYPLKLVLMSATLRGEDFGRIFNIPPPVIEVPTRQYPVTVQFSKRTDVVDYVGQACKKVLSMHRKQPPGGILVFLTGQREVEFLCRKLRKASKEIIGKRTNANTQLAADSECSLTELDELMDANEAFESQESSNYEITDRFSSYDEDYDDLSEDESESCYDLEDDGDLEFANPGEKLLYPMSLESDDLLTQGLQGNGNLGSLKTAFEALAGKRSLEKGLLQCLALIYGNYHLLGCL
ncbi:OLC1v1021257C1 [Oldenlandia corymbosa var. corymbosa]|uniref:RNA helicase n=1 Tax=Oldenlandia corymbosa var. corymbosa TaxID=529605 RepID=A0AAV1BWR5_OLDCO|nr:OLC1v1021257C1 [Oldenlandia corymbosa var. corymbosa]